MSAGDRTIPTPPKPYYWHGDDGSWQAWNEWLEANGLRNGGSQMPDTIWQAAWTAAYRRALEDAADPTDGTPR